ncbi:hypothetical protein ABZP36_013760 [Zizania latifolia]
MREEGRSYDGGREGGGGGIRRRASGGRNFHVIIRKKQNKAIALAWATKFTTRSSIFDKNFSLLGTDDSKDTITTTLMPVVRAPALVMCGDRDETPPINRRASELPGDLPNVMLHMREVVGHRQGLVHGELLPWLDTASPPPEPTSPAPAA